MTASPESNVTALRRPPVKKATLVRSDLAHTFDTFVRTIGEWWPRVPFSAGRERVVDITVERAVGGKVVETWDDGTTVDWGEIKVWDPPARFTMSWNGTPEPTEVELTFTELGPGLTRVAVEHRGWDALTETQLGEDCALAGGYTAGGYSVGWERILDAFKRTFA